MSIYIRPEDVAVTDLGDESLGMVGFDVYNPEDEDADRIVIGEWTPVEARRLARELLAMADVVETED